MKTIASILLAVFTLSCHGQERYVTITVKPIPDPMVGMLFLTNLFEIAEGETAHLVSLAPAVLPGGGTSVFVERDGQRYLLASGEQFASFPQPPTVTGPAKLLLIGTGGLATLRITPNSSDPQKTVIVLPGADNAAQITLQCSTNLTTWAPATNGLYSGDVAKFFRIHLEKAKP